eukprot:CAMPEP_0170530174 /NCGR_PEP_ID=MMETSP0209-20121228/42474_1 /TAXON_ID=665100 ORGANISM="Litonotus pictus, Strain P1" /NCGR_SAMPLE_ID=MMETSP0209 /ASSEMBLY_ACC=CAM_ASM_000301 /LENGTH=97 /DNA_ID=CAMNT_0010822995 /DNA_START=96 /DNA_END=386 /DNA_ORIENTATION=+
MKSQIEEKTSKDNVHELMDCKEKFKTKIYYYRDSLSKIMGKNLAESMQKEYLALMQSNKGSEDYYEKIQNFAQEHCPDYYEKIVEIVLFIIYYENQL